MFPVRPKRRRSCVPTSRCTTAPRSCPGARPTIEPHGRAPQVASAVRQSEAFRSVISPRCPQCGHVPGAGNRPASTSSTDTFASRATRKTMTGVTAFPPTTLPTVLSPNRSALLTAPHVPHRARRNRSAVRTFVCSVAVRSLTTAPPAEARTLARCPAHESRARASRGCGKGT
jgi:hypothetical protein